MFDASPRCPRLDLKAPRWGKLGGGDWRRREGGYICRAESDDKRCKWNTLPTLAASIRSLTGGPVPFNQSVTWLMQIMMRQPYTINSKISCCTRIQHYFLVSCPDELSLIRNARSMPIAIPSSGTNDSTDSIIISYSDDQSFQHNDVEPFTPCIAIRTSRRR